MRLNRIARLFVATALTLCLLPLRSKLREEAPNIARLRATYEEIKKASKKNCGRTTYNMPALDRLLKVSDLSQKLHDFEYRDQWEKSASKELRAAVEFLELSEGLSWGVCFLSDTGGAVWSAGQAGHYDLYVDGHTKIERVAEHVRPTPVPPIPYAQLSKQ